MKILKVDIDKTYEIYKKSKHLIKLGECYNNCINVLALILRKEYQEGKYKIGYCYVGGNEQQLVRHCVIVTDDDRVIDISAMLIYDIIELATVSKNKDVKYYIFAELGSMQLYLALEREGNMVGLKTVLSDYEKEFYDYTREYNLKINEVDFNEYIKELIK